MRNLVFGLLLVLASSYGVSAQTGSLFQQPMPTIPVTVNAASLSSPEGPYVIEFSTPIFEHDDVQSCREIKVASTLIQAICNSYGVSTAEFTRYSITVHAAKLIGQSTPSYVLIAIRQLKNIDFQRIEPSNVAIELPPLTP